MRKKRAKPVIEAILIVLLLLLLFMVGLMFREIILLKNSNQLGSAALAVPSASAEVQTQAEPTPAATAIQAVPEQAVVSAEKAQASMLEEADSAAEAGGSGTLNEDDYLSEDGAGIYSYLQQIKSYQDGEEWAGDWCYVSEPGSYKTFSDFGCGLCCLANMYCTITGDICTPDEMYEWAKEDSDYIGNGAISWKQVKTVAHKIGIGGKLCAVGTYSEFQQDMAESRTIMVLVSSAYDNAIWHNVAGHYVTIWEYNTATDTVFLTDSSFKANNRSRVALRDIYNALYLADEYQYMKVSE